MRPPLIQLLLELEFRDADLETVVEFSLRAWAPVFASIREVLGDDIFLRLHPDWKAGQAEAVRSSCTSGDRDVVVAVVGDRTVGFMAIALNAFHERMGVIDIIGVDPDYQRRGISSRLTEFAKEHMRKSWNGYRRGRNGRRSRPRPGSSGLREGRVHAVAYISLLPASRLSGPQPTVC